MAYMVWCSLTAPRLALLLGQSAGLDTAARPRHQTSPEMKCMQLQIQTARCTCFVQLLCPQYWLGRSEEQ